ncbi:MAG: response regulator transcription factor [Balneolaceae bacterium]
MTEMNEEANGMDILVVEDDPTVRTLVKAVLEHRGNNVHLADTAERGRHMVEEREYDMIILDLRLPDGNGFDICSEIRKADITTPVLFLSAEHETDVKIKCLKVGADDYITKPFDSEELLARIEAIRRRSDLSGEKELVCGNLKLDLIERDMVINGSSVSLTNNEFNLLAYLMRNRNRVISQDELAKNVWDIHFDTQTNYINVYISYLRKKIRDHSEEEYIETIRRKGFVLRCPDRKGGD